MSRGTEILLAAACVCVLAVSIIGGALYIKKHSASGCFLGYCGAVIKTP